MHLYQFETHNLIMIIETIPGLSCLKRNKLIAINSYWLNIVFLKSMPNFQYELKKFFIEETAQFR